MPTGERALPVANEVDISLARMAGAALADEVGFNLLEKSCLVTSISELASNIVRHAGSGRLYLRIGVGPAGQRGIEVVAADEGPGIAPNCRPFEDHVSTKGGMGCGLAGVRRLMSEVSIESHPGAGTRVRAVKWIGENHLRRP